MRTVTPGGLYYPGIARYGSGFAQDLGRLFEHYIGRNLRLIDGAEVHPEISYGSSKDLKSIDWFVVMPGLVLLIECKLKRLGLLGRAGDAPLFDDLTLSIEKAYQQLKRSVESLASRTPQFNHIPTDRPLLAMIVSAEPMYIGDAYLVDHHGASVSAGTFRDVPVMAMSARDIEMLVTHGAGVEQVLLELVQTHTPGSAISLRDVPPHDRRENTILVDAWNSYPFPRVDSADDHADLNAPASG